MFLHTWVLRGQHHLWDSSVILPYMEDKTLPTMSSFNSTRGGMMIQIWSKVNIWNNGLGYSPCSPLILHALRLKTFSYVKLNLCLGILITIWLIVELIDNKEPTFLACQYLSKQFTFLNFCLFIDSRERGRKGERVRNKNKCEKETWIRFLLHAPQLGTEPASWAYSLTGNQTCHLLVCGGWCPTNWATLAKAAIYSLTKITLLSFLFNFLI